MATRKELRAKITEARALTQRAIVEVAGNWEKPAAAGAGEDAWAPRQAIQHAAEAELFFASLVSKSCGYPELELQKMEFATPADAAEGCVRVSAKADAIIQYVSDDDLKKPITGERFPGMTVEGLLALTGHHTREHAEQALAAGR
ncbi:MAG: DinB family protein [Dehalococcoidia bacterium]